MAKTPYIVGNWKMNGLVAGARSLVLEISDYLSDNDVVAPVVVCPPATLLARLSEVVEDDFALGGQDCHMRANGAFTGDVSAEMLADAGASYVIVGHSERRTLHGETNAKVREKAETALEVGLQPIICVGESLEEQEADRTMEVVEKQVLESVPESVRGDALEEPLLIAYEPVWAIGSGKIPSLDEISMVHGAILATLFKHRNLPAEKVAVLYGGSVKPDNAYDILAIDSVGGVLVGGASLQAESFCGIIGAANDLMLEGAEQ